ncbi:MAG: hypothetical protein SAL07_22615 [Oscillatoria sp. PMC 1051.18]|nr:hypothetical protein [Oscillatoria sp. PMC 1051.18]
MNNWHKMATSDVCPFLKVNLTFSSFFWAVEGSIDSNREKSPIINNNETINNERSLTVKEWN